MRTDLKGNRTGPFFKMAKTQCFIVLGTSELKQCFVEICVHFCLLSTDDTITEHNSSCFKIALIVYLFLALYFQL